MLYIPFPFKRCTKCGKDYLPNRDNFQLAPKMADKLNSWCRQCHREYDKQYSKSNPDRRYTPTRRQQAREATARYRHTHPDQVRVTMTKWQNDNREYTREYARQRTKNNPEHVSGIRKKSYQKNSEKVRNHRRQNYANNPEKAHNYGKRYRQENPERVRESWRKWSKKNPDKLRKRDQKKRNRQLNLPATFTVAEWHLCLSWWNYTCAYCGNATNTLQQDHFIPQSPDYKLTGDNLGYVSANILPACPTCNMSKKNRNPTKWLQKRLGNQQAATVLSRIQEYFEWVKNK